MIRLKSLIQEISNNDLQRILQKIQNKQFTLFGQGDNGRVYEFEGEDGGTFTAGFSVGTDLFWF